MAVIYFGGALIVVIENYQNIIPSFHSIFSQVFSGSAAAGGFLGASFAMSLKLGVARGLYSNEAGQGSSPIAHASAKTEHSVEQGMVRSSRGGDKRSAAMPFNRSVAHTRASQSAAARRTCFPILLSCKATSKS